MGFNNKYLMDALKASDCDMVKLEINGALSSDADSAAGRGKFPVPGAASEG